MAAHAITTLAPIAYRCGAPSHESAPVRESSTVTFHRDGWAYCPSADTAHRWVATGGVPLQELLVRPSHRSAR